MPLAKFHQIQNLFFSVSKKPHVPKGKEKSLQKKRLGLVLLIKETPGFLIYSKAYCVLFALFYFRRISLAHCFSNEEKVEISIDFSACHFGTVLFPSLIQKSHSYSDCQVAVSL